MNIRTVSVFALSAATPLAFGATSEASGSPTELHPVTVEAPKTTPAVRFDIRAACPGIDTELQNTLSSAWGWVQKTGTYPVQLRVEGNRVIMVWSSAASIAYRPYLHAAVAKLACTDAAAEAQDFKFLLVIRDPDDRSMSPHVALIQDK